MPIVHKILIVDDERAIAETLARIFETKGYETRTAGAAEEVLVFIGDWLPALAIIDVALPGMSGIELAILLTDQCPSCRLLLFSGHAGTGELLEEAEVRGHRFEVLAKPVHPSVLLEKVGNLLKTQSHTCE